MKKIIGLSLLAITLFSSCKKEEPTPTCTLSATSIIGTYKTTASTSQADAQSPVVDDFATWDACEKDDLITFSSGNVLNFSEGSTSCTPPTDPFSATWTITGNSLIISFMGFTLPASSISAFTCSGFKITTIDDTSGEINVTTLTKQ